MKALVSLPSPAKELLTSFAAVHAKPATPVVAASAPSQAMAMLRSSPRKMRNTKPSARILVYIGHSHPRLQRRQHPNLRHGQAVQHITNQMSMSIAAAAMGEAFM